MLTIEFNSSVYDLEKMIIDIPEYVDTMMVKNKEKMYSILCLTTEYANEGNILLWAQQYFNPVEARDEFRVPTRDVVFSFSTPEEKEAIIDNRFNIVGIQKAWAYTEGPSTVTFHIPY